MQMEYFKEFVELARAANYTAAARALNISQSVLSKHIKAMEGELNVVLFVRGKRGVELSEYGFALLPYATQIIGIEDRYLSEIAAVKSSGSVLRIGSVPAVKQMGIGALIARFVEENPGVAVNILENESATLIDILQRQECDIAFVRGIDNRYSVLNKVPFIKDRVALLLPSAHPLAQKDGISIMDLRKENLIINALNTNMHGVLTAACHEMGFEPNIVYTNNNGRHSLEIVERGLGLAIMNERVGVAWVKRYENLCLRVIAPNIETTVYAYYNKDISPVAEAFLLHIIGSDIPQEE